MIQVRIKRVYEDFSETDGYRVLVDKLWPRGMKKEWLKYDYWAKDITPSSTLRRWFHEDIPGHCSKRSLRCTKRSLAFSFWLTRSSKTFWSPRSFSKAVSRFLISSCNLL